MDKDLKPMPDVIYVVGKSADLHKEFEDLFCLWSHKNSWNEATKYTRATDCPAVDLDALKSNGKHDVYGFELGKDYTEGYNDAIDHLASRNLIRGAVESIEGLGEALEAVNKYRESNFDKVVLLDDYWVKYKKYPHEVIEQAAEKYQAMTKGE